jgi:hypothetical protein
MLRICAAAFTAAALPACATHTAGNTLPPVGGSEATLPHHRTFHYTGKRQRFIVPPGVKSITVVARGAAGGGSPSRSGGPQGGRGGRVFAIIPVTGGEKLYVFVGGPASGSDGGFNGGANAGSTRFGGEGGGGGGASDVRAGGDRLSQRILVVGGGGGAGAQNIEQYGVGGSGGGSQGDAGGVGWHGSSVYGGGGGGGGTQTAGGPGGRGGEGTFGSGGGGTSGTLGHGGAGGFCPDSSYCYQGGNGGGGGGGYYGGGGGGAGAEGTSYGGGGGGGGGGSDYVESGVKRFRSWTGWKDATGNGLVVFSW